MTRFTVPLDEVSNVQLVAEFGIQCAIELGEGKLDPDSQWCVLAAEIIRRLNKAQEESK